jgi:hypothetical protein
MTSHDSVNFFLQFKILARFLRWKITILAFWFFHTWDFTILLNLTNCFHQFSLGSSRSTHFNDSPSSEACFLQNTTVFIAKKSEIQIFHFGESIFPILKPTKCNICIKSFDISSIQLGFISPFSWISPTHFIFLFLFQSNLIIWRFSLV